MSQRYLGGVITANPTTPTTASASGVWTLGQQLQNLSALQPKRISNSVRLRSSASAYFNRTPASAGNQKTWTWSSWVKRGSLDTASYYTLFASGNNVVNSLFAFRIASSTGAVNDQLWVRQYNPTTGSYDLDVGTTAVYRDPSAWYHIVLVYDSSNATSTDRLIIYVNGVRQSLSYTAGPVPLNRDSQINMARLTTMGVFTTNTSINYFDGYLTEINFIDGQALTPSSFGAYDSTGVWQPLGYTGTYGTNGFYLNFSDTSGATATTIGKDYSGNGNNWTPNNISVTAGVTYDAMIDSPTNYSDGSAYGRGNYCTLNPVFKNANATYGVMATPSDGNLNATMGSGTNVYSTMALPTSGKIYVECEAVSWTSQLSIGFMSDDGNANRSAWWNNANGIYVDNAQQFAGATSTGIIGIAVDCDAKTVQFYRDNSARGSAYVYSTGSVSAHLFWAYTNSGATVRWNFGQRPFTYTPPTGFKALNTVNLPASNIPNGAQYMAATLYTGNGSTQSISNGANNPIGTTFQPDFAWIKKRNSATNGSHQLVDSVRGTSAYLFSDSTIAEITASDRVTALNSSGFALSTASQVNGSADTFVGWQWKAGGNAASNTSGTITSSVSANTTAGFSVVTYTGTGALATVGHGLGVAPSMVIIKSRSQVANWTVYHSSVGNTGALFLNLTNATDTGSAYWNNTSPTSSVFTINLGSASNTSGQTYVAYCFAAVRGYSAFGSYTGNGSTDGPFVYCGFRPRWLLLKNTGGTASWYCLDSSRNTYNVVDAVLVPNSSQAEVAITSVDFLSNGFKLKTTTTDINGSGTTYIYAAFAENPFNTSRAR